MKYKHAFAVGNLLMAIGMVLMLGSLGYNLLSHIFPLGGYLIFYLMLR